LSSDGAVQLVAALTSTTPCTTGGPFRTTCDRLRRNKYTLVSVGERVSESRGGGTSLQHQLGHDREEQHQSAVCHHAIVTVAAAAPFATPPIIPRVDLPICCT
jgi:hypothetical protein